MLVTYQKIVNMLTEAYEAGKTVCCDMKDQSIDEIIAKNLSKTYEIRVYSVEELKQFPVGSQFYHSLLGVGTIVNKKGVRTSFMKFENGVMNAFTSDQFPWTMPMLCLKTA